jgi:hypothetical protein
MEYPERVEARPGKPVDEAYHLYLVLEPFSTGAQTLRARRPLWEGDDRFLVGADGYFEPSTSTGVIDLRFRSELGGVLGPSGLRAFVHNCGLPIVMVEELPAEQRTRFLERLAACSIYVQLFTCEDSRAEGPVIERVLVALSEHAKEADPGAGTAGRFDEWTDDGTTSKRERL